MPATVARGVLVDAAVWDKTAWLTNRVSNRHACEGFIQ
jgi:hypothetical protein